MKKNKILAIAGPTASGKTGLSVELAKRLNGEIICCDSMQIYKYMNIGTAKPTLDEMQNIPHHLFDFVDPNYPFSCAEYVPLARQKIDEITQRGHLPILCGGTGLYLDSVLYQKDYSPDIDSNIRRSLEKYTDEEAYELLKKYDCESASVIHKNNRKRVNRALEIYLGTGRTKTVWDRELRGDEALYDADIVVLSFSDRDKLYQRINRRVDIMINSGLEDEVRSIDFLAQSTAKDAIGYKEFRQYFKGEISLSDTVEMIKQATRRYAKRQQTWFKREKNQINVVLDTFDSSDDIVNFVLNCLTSAG